MLVYRLLLLQDQVANLLEVVDLRPPTMTMKYHEIRHHQQFVCSALDTFPGQHECEDFELYHDHISPFPVVLGCHKFALYSAYALDSARKIEEVD